MHRIHSYQAKANANFYSHWVMSKMWCERSIRVSIVYSILLPKVLLSAVNFQVKDITNLQVFIWSEHVLEYFILKRLVSPNTLILYWLINMSWVTGKRTYIWRKYSKNSFNLCTRKYITFGIRFKYGTKYCIFPQTCIISKTLYKYNFHTIKIFADK